MRYTRALSAAKASRNLTGFSPRALAAASGSPPNDPWAKREAWRYTGPFSRRNRFREAFPGFGIAAAAFAVYCGYEYLFLNDDHYGHAEEGHGGEHH